MEWRPVQQFASRDRVELGKLGRWVSGIKALE
jgi:hypothetical protein